MIDKHFFSLGLLYHVTQNVDSGQPRKIQAENDIGFGDEFGCLFFKVTGFFGQGKNLVVARHPREKMGVITGCDDLNLVPFLLQETSQAQGRPKRVGIGLKMGYNNRFAGPTDKSFERLQVFHERGKNTNSYDL